MKWMQKLLFSRMAYQTIIPCFLKRPTSTSKDNARFVNVQPANRAANYKIKTATELIYNCYKNKFYT